MSVRLTTLTNGLRIVTQRMESVESISLGVWINVGTRHEKPEINGIAHMLEHMAFKGTERRNARAIAEEIEAVGGQLNAYTSREFTAYYATVIRGDEMVALDIIADILQWPSFDPEEMERERTVILQEIGQATDTPDDIVFDRFQATAFPDQPVGRPVLGTGELVSGLSRDALATYMTDHYRADRMVLAAAGNLDHDIFVTAAESAFSALGHGAPPAHDSAKYAGGDFREDRSLEQVHLLLGFEGVAYADPDYYALSVLSTILGGGMSSRLFQEIRENRGLVYSIYAFTSSYVDTGLFGVYAGTGPDQLAELVPALSDIVRRAGTDIGDDEVMRARAQIRAGILMSLESTSARCEQLARQILVFDRPIPPEEVTRRIEAVDIAALERVASRLTSGAPTLAALGPVGPLESFDSVVTRLA